MTLTVDLWNTLRAEAEQRGVVMSVVVRERLWRSYGVALNSSDQDKPLRVPMLDRRRQCRLWVESSLWGQLTTEAETRGLTRAAVIRERLRQAQVGERRSVTQQELSLSTTESSLRTGSKTVSLFDFSD